MAEMKVITNMKEMLSYRKSLPSDTMVGLVATMGYLHDGHGSLISMSVAETDVTVVLIFVNPKQFAPHEDYATYPRDLERDLGVCRARKATAVYAPDSVDDIYPDGFSTRMAVAEGDAERNASAEGAMRPTFFQGVATVLARLFGTIQPTHAYFGQKDAQQCAVVHRLLSDIFVHTKLIVGPIVREPDGLAMSSRNKYLSPDHRRRATALYAALQEAVALFRDRGVNTPDKLRACVKDCVAREQGDAVAVEYVSVCDRWSMLEIEEDIPAEQSCLLCIAAKVGTTRLLDNVVLRE